MIARKKTYNSIARSFRSKPSLLVYLFFFSLTSKCEQIKEHGSDNCFYGPIFLPRLLSTFFLFLSICKENKIKPLYSWLQFVKLTL